MSGKSKGFGYVEFEELESVPAALLLNGTKFCMRHEACSCSGFPLAVKAAEAERNYAAAAEAAGGNVQSANADRRVYVCNLALAVTEADLKVLAEQFGAVERVVIFRDRRNRERQSKGSGFIIFRDVGVIALAKSQLHQLPVGGQPIAAGSLNEAGLVVTPTGEAVPLNGSGGGGGGGEGGGGAADSGVGAGGLSMQARAVLMARLSSLTATATAALTSAVTASTAAAPEALAQYMVPLPLPPAALTPALGAANLPTNCCFISGCFTGAEKDPNWAQDIHDEIAEELGTFGRVVWSHLDVADTARGRLYAMFVDETTAQSAVEALRGRKYDGRLLGAELVPVADFLTTFPQSMAAAATLVK